MAGEIISADSMQVYRRMDIGTAKPSREEQAAIPHHLLDILDPSETYNAGRFQKDASAIIRDLWRRGAPIIVAGGTGLYVKALLRGLFDAPRVDPELRDRLLEEAARIGPARFHATLHRIDPESAARLHPNDTVRIARALEVYRLTGRSLTAHHADHRFENRPFRALTIGLMAERNRLYERIDRRVDDMMNAGWLQEVQSLVDQGFTEATHAMKGLGYRQILLHLLGRLPLDEAVAAIKQETRRFAKRQMAWFRSVPEVDWHPIPVDGEITIRSFSTFLDAVDSPLK